ncbi:uncharacterized protein LOC130804017 isoform X2 [Amaranthus tricolor]|uniref:uncharacterized protein LOC130804017 isoform X2 n=1 Tax=Amaranthus tricolor TaxID=29722 RepID=UPI002583FCB2|nr:uncharacterized protein LOC130804017 isoform X2 [Amaranthus tricolor]
MDVQLGRKPMNVQLNWIPGRSELENENLLSAFGISLAIDRRVAKENLKAKNPDLMKKFSVMRFAQAANQRAAEKPLPLPPKDSATAEKGLDGVPSEGEALRLLEERRRVHIPDESKRAIPPKKKEVKKKERKRKRDSSPAESATKKASMDTIRTVVPLQMRSAEGEVSTPQGNAVPVSSKGKEKVGESATTPDSHVGEVYRHREVLPFRHDTLFTDLGHKGMITRFNRASSHLISKVDVDHLESLSPCDRVRQFQASVTETFLRLSFELNLAALTSRCDDQNEELKKLREDLGELPSLKEKLAKCAELKERLVKTEQWREKAKKQLEGTIGSLDAASSLSATLGHETRRLMDIHARLVYQNQSLMHQVSDDLAKFQTLLSAAKVYKLRSERRAKIARDWLTSDEPEASSFLGDLTAEMMDAGFRISDEKYRLAAAELGINFDSLQQMANQKGDEALTNLASVLERESAVLVDPSWDVEEERAWSEKVDMEAEKEALCLDLDKLALSPPSAPDVPESLALSKLESLCLDLSNLIIDEGKNLQGLSKKLSEIEVEPFNIEDFVSFTPSLDEGVARTPQLPPQDPEGDVDAFLNDV